MTVKLSLKEHQGKLDSHSRGSRGANNCVGEDEIDPSGAILSVVAIGRRDRRRMLFKKVCAHASFAKRVYEADARGGGLAWAGGQGVYQFVATMLKSPAELERNSNEWERVALSICPATPKLSSA